LPSKLRPERRQGDPWTVQLDSALQREAGSEVLADATVTLVQRSILVLRTDRA
jgi:hypothetical protein